MIFNFNEINNILTYLFKIIPITYLRSSIGGCAPNYSKAGMLISSINTIIFLPAGGPTKSLPFLINLSEMNKSNKLFAVVYALKLKLELTNLSGLIF